MLIRMACPAPPGSLHGNRVTALRWTRILRSLGHSVQVAEEYDGQRCDLLIALQGKPIAGVDQLHRHLTGRDIGRKITISMLRDSHKLDLEIIPVARPEME